MTNFSEDQGQVDTYGRLFCSTEVLTGITTELICLSVLNSFLSITAFLGNTLIQVALYKESSLYTPTKLLLRTLSMTDLFVGLISEPLVVVYWLSVVKEHWSICRYALTATFISTYTLGPVSLLTLTAIGVDRLLALLLGLRYRQVVTFERTFLAVITFWVICISSAAMYFWNYQLTLWYGNIVTSLSLVTSVFSYTKIFFNLRHHQNQVQGRIQPGQPNQLSQLNIARYRKAVSSALWLQLTLVACYLPQGIVGALWTNRPEFSPSLYLARQFASTLVFLNSSLNPILYCWKIREVRQALKDTIRNL